MSNELLYKLLNSSDSYMSLLALIVSFAFRKNIPRSERLLMLYLVINFIFSVITNVMGYYRINNLVLYHFFTLFEQWFISWYLVKIITKRKVPSLYYYVNGGFTVFWIINILSLEPYTVYNSNTAVVSSLIILLLCMYYMLELSKSEDILYFQRLPSFWIVSGFLIYNALGILIFAVYSYYTAYSNSGKGTLIGIDSWFVMHLPIVLKYIMISVGILCYKKDRLVKQTNIVML